MTGGTKALKYWPVSRAQPRDWPGQDTWLPPELPPSRLRCPRFTRARAALRDLIRTSMARRKTPPTLYALCLHAHNDPLFKEPDAPGTSGGRPAYVFDIPARQSALLWGAPASTLNAVELQE
jgi:hypothetical protein